MRRSAPRIRTWLPAPRLSWDRMLATTSVLAKWGRRPQEKPAQTCSIAWSHGERGTPRPAGMWPLGGTEPVDPEVQGPRAHWEESLWTHPRYRSGAWSAEGDRDTRSVQPSADGPHRHTSPAATAAVHSPQRPYAQ